MEMSLKLARERRLDALKNRNDDRILVKPAEHHTQVKLPDPGTIADFLIDALRHGTDLGQLAAETGWSRSTVLVNLYKVAKKTGVGIRRSQDALHLMLPNGAGNIFPNLKVVNTTSTIRAMASEVSLTPPPGHAR
jgi:hypothetical protein